jgi:hypothetical protein
MTGVPSACASMIGMPNPSGVDEILRRPTTSPRSGPGLPLYREGVDEDCERSRSCFLASWCPYATAHARGLSNVLNEISLQSRVNRPRYPNERCCKW